MPVVNMACPKCRREATEYAPNKWKCLHCGIKFLYEAPTPTPSVSVTKVVRGGVDQSEKTLLNFGGIHRVTTSKVKFGNVTFPVANIATVRYSKEDKFLSAIVVVAVCLLFGIPFALGGLAGLVTGREDAGTGFFVFAIGAATLAYGFLRWQQRKPVHTLSVTMNSGETHDLPSRDLDGIRQIEEAIHTAIAAQ
jgi:hypothetical protein